MSNYKVFSRTEKSREPEHRENEDSYLYMEYCLMNDEKIRILTVADGMGGLSNAKKASFHAVKGFAQAVFEQLLDVYMENANEKFSMTYYAEKLEFLVREAVKEANRNVCRHAEPFPPTGTTLSVVVILGNYAVVANVGDSPVYYYDAEMQELALVSKLHTRAEKDVEKGLYRRYSGEYYEHEHIIYKSLGDKEELKEEDIFVKVIGGLRKKDMFLLGSDGAFGRLINEEIIDIIENTRDNLILKRLFEEARLYKDDDQTAVLYQICGEEDV